MPAIVARKPGYDTPNTPTRPLLFGTFLISQSTVSYVSVLSSVPLASAGSCSGRFMKNCPSLPYRPRMSCVTNT